MPSREERLADLRRIARQVYEAVEPHGPENAVHARQWLASEHGIEPKMHAGNDAVPTDAVMTLEWHLGQFVDLVDHKSWFAMNSLLNRLYELSEEPASEPEPESERDPCRYRQIRFEYTAPEGWDQERENDFLDALLALIAKHDLQMEGLSGGPLDD